MVGGTTAAISAGIATLPEVTGMAVATAITGTGVVGTEAVGMVAVTTVADIGTETLTGGGITHSDLGTTTTITNRDPSDYYVDAETLTQ